MAVFVNKGTHLLYYCNTELSLAFYYEVMTSFSSDICAASKKNIRSIFLLYRTNVLLPTIKKKIAINFIKSIYAIYQNRETFFEESLQGNVDLIFDTIYRYMRKGGK